MKNELDQLLVEYKPSDLKGAVIWLPNCPPEVSAANKPLFTWQTSNSSYLQNIYNRKKVAAY